MTRWQGATDRFGAGAGLLWIFQFVVAALDRADDLLRALGMRFGNENAHTADRRGQERIGLHQVVVGDDGRPWRRRYRAAKRMTAHS